MKLLKFLQSATTAWHACHEVIQQLTGYTRLNEKEEWDIKAGGKYYVQRGGSLIAFQMAKKRQGRAKIIGAHTDSPGLKLKPAGEFEKEGFVLLNFEVYGAPILSSWIGRKLVLSGRLFVEEKGGTIKEELVTFSDFPLTIAPLAIHLDRTQDENAAPVNKQDQLSAIACRKELLSPNQTFLQKLFGKRKMLHFELFAVIEEPIYLSGVKNEFLTAPRLDNIVSCHAALEAFKEAKADDDTIQMMALWNHEEIGSRTYEGAQSTFFNDVFQRICKEDLLRIKASSQALSVDVAHAVHPYFSEKSEPRHKSGFGSGVVVKFNADEKYASHPEVVASFIQLLEKHNIPYSKYTARGDTKSGSTLGPIHATQSGIKTADIGLPLLGMHASSEMIATEDYESLKNALRAFLK